MKCTLFALFAVLSLGVSSHAYGCGHKPTSAGVDKVFEQLAQQAIIVHHNGFEDLIINVKYRFRGPGQNPDNLAWLIPTPHTPVSYKVADPAIFKEALKVFPDTDGTIGFYKGGARRLTKKPTRQIKLLGLVSVGNYQIQPIVTTGPQAATELNEWLSKNGYGTVPIKNMSWYLKKKWTFLAIKMVHKGNAKGMPDIGEFKPLHLRFKSKKIIYPLKFSSHQGVFNVSLFVITSRRLNHKWRYGYGLLNPERYKNPEEVDYRTYHQRGAGAFWQAAKYGFETAFYSLQVPFQNIGPRKRRLLKRTKGGLENFPHLYRLLMVIDARDPLPNQLFFNKFNGRNVNGEDNKVADWKDDFAIDYLEDEESVNKVFSVEDRFRYLVKQFTYFNNEVTYLHKESSYQYMKMLPISEEERSLLLWMRKAQRTRNRRRRRGDTQSLDRTRAFQWLDWIHEEVERAYEAAIPPQAVIKGILASLSDAGKTKSFLSGAPALAREFLSSDNVKLRLFAVSGLVRQISKIDPLKTHQKALECLKKAQQDKDERVRKLADNALKDLQER